MAVECHEPRIPGSYHSFKRLTERLLEEEKASREATQAQVNTTGRARSVLRALLDTSAALGRQNAE